MIPIVNVIDEIKMVEEVNIAIASISPQNGFVINNIEYGYA